MKKLVLSLSLFAFVALTANAQEKATPTTGSKATPTTSTSSPKPAAKPATPTTSPKPTTETAPVVMKDHVCTVACKDGAHVYAHGEKGHTCGDACKKMKTAKSTKMAPKKTTGAATTPASSTPASTPAAGTATDEKSLKMKK